MTQHKAAIISARQIKAARALLDWSQDDLAEASGLSIATIRKIEAGNTSPRGKTNAQLKKAIEHAGLEFLDPDGVRRKPDDITIHQGREGAIAFLDDIYQTARIHDDPRVCVSYSENDFVDAVGDYFDLHIERMKPFPQQSHILMNDIETLPAPYCDYRSLSKAYVDSVPFYVYGDNYAILLFDVQPSPKIIVHHSPQLAEVYRRQFFSMWDKATPLSKPKKK